MVKLVMRVRPRPAPVLSHPIRWRSGTATSPSRGSRVIAGPLYGRTGLHLATSATPITATAGTLRLTLADNGVGFTQPVSAIAPGDTIKRYVTLTAGGTLDATGLTLVVAPSASNALTVDGATTRSLRVAVNSCSSSWTVATGTCTGTTTALVAAAPLASYASPVSLSSGPITAGTTVALQVVLTLPDQDETTLNGVAPTTTVQGQSATLAWSFTVRQRATTITSG